eukprot:2139815-Amphidinium_carterae.1
MPPAPLAASAFFKSASASLILASIRRCSSPCPSVGVKVIFELTAVPRLSETKAVSATLVSTAVHMRPSASIIISTGVGEDKVEFGKAFSSNCATAFPCKTMVTSLGKRLP